MSYLRIFLIYFGSVWVAYLAYVFAAAPWIEPEPSVRPNDVALSVDAPKGDTRRLADLFPADAWERQNPKMVETEQGLLILKDYLPTADGRVELKPFTLVYYPSRGAPSQASERAIVLQAPEGALLQFDRAMDLRRADVGKLLSGRLTGEVRIWSRESEPGAGDAIEVITRNVQMSPEKIWTPQEVRFQFGRSQGSGRDFILHLRERGVAANGKTSKSAEGIRGPKLLELVHVDKVRLDIGSTEMPSNPFSGWMNAVARSKQDKPLVPELRTAKSQEASTPVEITCRGPFMFNFERQVASFEDHVDVRRILPDGPSDELSCQLLEAHFGRDDKSKPVGKMAGDKSATKNQPLALDGQPSPPKNKMPGPGLQRLVALGHPVYFRAPTMSISLKAERLEYDLLNRRLSLEGERRVQLQRQRQFIEAAQLTYQMPEAGGLGNIWASGPGTFRGPLRDGETDEMDLAWGTSLQLRPHEGRQVLSLIDAAAIGMPQMGRLAASQIHVWVQQLPALVAVSPASFVDQRNASAPAESRFVPERMLALGNVQMDSSQFQGRTDRLEMYVAQPQPSAAASQPAGSPISPASDLSKSPVPKEKPSSARSGDPLFLTGKLVRVQLQAKGEEYVLSEASIDGDVRMTQAPAGGKPNDSFSILGDTLYLRQPAPDDAYVKVVGKPARIAARSIDIAGSNVQLDRRQNHVWIEGGGEMRVPLTGDLIADSFTPNAPEAATRAVNREVSAPASAGALVTWRQRLDFNGASLRFLGDVNIRTDAQMITAAALDAFLTEPVDLAAGKSPAKVAIRQFVLRGGVAVESRGLDEEKHLLSIDRLKAGELTVDQVTGEVSATGPGILSSVRRANSLVLPDMAPGVGSDVNSASKGSPAGGFAAVQNAPTAKDGLSFLSVGFERGIAGNIGRREVKFLERVKVLYGPVKGWEDSLVGNSPAELGPDGILLHCDQLSLREMNLFGASRKPVEILAEGNSLVEGNGFTARSHRLAYTQMKDQLVLEGDSRADAELWRKSPAGGPASHAAARKILFWRKDNRVEVEDARFLDLGSLPGAAPKQR